MGETVLKTSVIINLLKIIFKTLIFILLLVTFFIIGLLIGYSIIGDGNFWEVLNRDTWQHILNFIN